MKDCEEIKRLITKNFSDDISNDEKNHLENHVQKCDECYHEFQLQERMEIILSEREFEQPHQNLLDNIFKKIELFEKQVEKPSINWGLNLIFLSFFYAWPMGILFYFKSSSIVKIINAFFSNLLFNFTQGVSLDFKFENAFYILIIYYSLVLLITFLFIKRKEILTLI